MNSLSENDLRQVAEIHKTEFGGTDFLSGCSKNFVEYFYRRTTEDNRNQLFIVKENETVAGFAFFTLSKDTLFKNFLKNNVIQILITPSALQALIKTLVLKSKRSLEHQYDFDLVYLAVSRVHRSKGFARELLGHVEKFCSANSLDCYYLQVHKDNKTAVSFYLKYGFTIIEEYTSRGRMKLLMRKSIK